MLEDQARTVLFDLAARYEAACGVSAATVAKRAIRDNTFFKRLNDPNMSFTFRTFDRIISWFSDNWPSHVAWPEAVVRPSKAFPSIEGQGLSAALEKSKSGVAA